MYIKSKDYSTNYGFLKRIISADDVVSDAFRYILNKMKGLQEPTVQTSTGGSCMCNQPQQEKGTFQRLETWLRSTMTKERFSNLIVLNNHKERTANLPLRPPTPPPIQKRWLLGLAL